MCFLFSFQYFSRLVILLHCKLDMLGIGVSREEELVCDNTFFWSKQDYALVTQIHTADLIRRQCFSAYRLFIREIDETLLCAMLEILYRIHITQAHRHDGRAMIQNAQVRLWIEHRELRDIVQDHVNRNLLLCAGLQQIFEVLDRTYIGKLIEQEIQSNYCRRRQA